MKRTSVRMSEPTRTYGRNVESERASAEIKRNAFIVPLAGLSLIGMIATFIIAHL